MTQHGHRRSCCAFSAKRMWQQHSKESRRHLQDGLFVGMTLGMGFFAWVANGVLGSAIGASFFDTKNVIRDKCGKIKRHTCLPIVRDARTSKWSLWSVARTMSGVVYLLRFVKLQAGVVSLAAVLMLLPDVMILSLRRWLW